MIELKYKGTLFRNVIALFLIIVFAVPSTVFAAEAEPVTPCASYYLSSYSAYVYVTTAGQVQVWFDVMGTGDMDEIGSLRIVLYESSDNKNWSIVKTFLHDSTSGMLFEDDYYVSSHVSWSGGSTNKYYKAYVCVWAGKNGTGDTRYFWAYEP